MVVLPPIVRKGGVVLMMVVCHRLSAHSDHFLGERRTTRLPIRFDPVRPLLFVLLTMPLFSDLSEER